MAELTVFASMDNTGCQGKRPKQCIVEVLKKKKGRIDIPPLV
jgi:hypothetical protein